MPCSSRFPCPPLDTPSRLACAFPRFLQLPLEDARCKPSSPKSQPDFCRVRICFFPPVLLSFPFPPPRFGIRIARSEYYPPKKLSGIPCGGSVALASFRPPAPLGPTTTGFSTRTPVPPSSWVFVPRPWPRSIAAGRFVMFPSFSSWASSGGARHIPMLLESTKWYAQRATIEPFFCSFLLVSVLVFRFLVLFYRDHRRAESPRFFLLTPFFSD